MGKAWIIDVLTDLQAFSALNDLPELQAGLTQVIATARRELSAPRGRPAAQPADCAEHVPQAEGATVISTPVVQTLPPAVSSL